MKVKEESEKVGLKLNIQKIKFMASSPITSSQIEGRKVEVLTDLMFLGSKIISDSDCSHEIKRRLLLGKKTMTNLDSIFKSKTLLCKQRSTQSKLWFFQWCMDVRVGPWRRLSAKELMFLNCLKQLNKTLKLEKTLQNPWTAERSNQPIFLKEINSEYSLERLLLKLKRQYFGHLIGKDADAGKDWSKMTRGQLRMVGITKRGWMA